MSSCIYIADSAYDTLNEYEGEHENGFTIEADPTSGGWLITGDIEAFKEWIDDEGLAGSIE